MGRFDDAWAETIADGLWPIQFLRAVRIDPSALGTRRAIRTVRIWRHKALKEDQAGLEARTNLQSLAAALLSTHQTNPPEQKTSEAPILPPKARSDLNPANRHRHPMSSPSGATSNSQPSPSGPYPESRLHNQEKLEKERVIPNEEPLRKSRRSNEFANGLQSRVANASSDNSKPITPISNSGRPQKPQPSRIYADDRSATDTKPRLPSTYSSTGKSDDILYVPDDKLDTEQLRVNQLLPKKFQPKQDLDLDRLNSKQDLDIGLSSPAAIRSNSSPSLTNLVNQSATENLLRNSEARSRTANPAEYISSFPSISKPSSIGYALPEVGFDMLEEATELGKKPKPEPVSSRLPSESSNAALPRNPSPPTLPPFSKHNPLVAPRSPSSPESMQPAVRRPTSAPPAEKPKSSNYIPKYQKAELPENALIGVEPLSLVDEKSLNELEFPLLYKPQRPGGAFDLSREELSHPKISFVDRPQSSGSLLLPPHDLQSPSPSEEASDLEVTQDTPKYREAQRPSTTTKEPSNPAVPLSAPKPYAAQRLKVAAKPSLDLALDNPPEAQKTQPPVDSSSNPPDSVLASEPPKTPEIRPPAAAAQVEAMASTLIPLVEELIPLARPRRSRRFWARWREVAGDLGVRRTFVENLLSTVDAPIKMLAELIAEAQGVDTQSVIEHLDHLEKEAPLPSIPPPPAYENS